MVVWTVKIDTPSKAGHVKIASRSTGAAAAALTLSSMASVWLDEADIPAALSAGPDLPQSVGYRVKRRLLGPPLTRDELKHERLSKRLALGVLSSDCISSSAYGSEEMLLILLPAFGLTAFTILLPLTGVILAVLFIVTMSYRDVVRIYTKAGGSYVVAREMFGPTVAQVAAVALMLDYIVTVAVQAAAGTLAVTSAAPSLAPWNLQITIAVVLLLFYGNLRGLREAVPSRSPRTSSCCRSAWSS